MKKLIILFLLAFSFVNAQISLDGGIHKVPSLFKLSGTNVSPVSSWNLLPFSTGVGNLGASGTIWNYGYFDTTVTNHLANTTWTLNSVAVTTTGTQLNYLSGATGTTGTTTTNLVFSTSPVLVTPTLGVAGATSLALTDGTDTYKMLVSSDKWTLQNDAGSPLTMWTVDSTGQLYNPNYITNNTAFRIGSFEFFPSAVNNWHIVDNAYYNGSNWIYRATGYGVKMQVNAGVFYIQTAPSGTLGDVATFTQRLSLDQSGVLTVPGNITSSGGAVNAATSVNANTTMSTGKSGGTSGQLNFIMSDNDLFNIGGTTDDQMTFNGASGGYNFDNSIIGTFGATSKLLLDGSTTGHTDTAGLLDINMSPTAAATGTVMADLALTSPSAGFGATTHYGINLSFTGDSDDNASSIVQLIQMGFTPNSSPTTVYGLYGNDSDLDYFIFEDGGAPVRFDGIVYAMNNANALQLGDDVSDTDIVMNWKANSSDGTITFMEDEDRFDFDNDVKVGGEIYLSNGSVSAPSLTFTNDTNSGIYFLENDFYGFASGGTVPAGIGNSGFLVPNSFYLGFTNGAPNTGVTDIRLYRDAAYILAQKVGVNPQNFRIYSKDATGTNDRWTSNGWGTGADSLKYSIAETHNGGSAQGNFNLTGFSSYLLDNNLTLGAGTATVDYTITVNGEDNDGVITYDEDNDSFGFDNDVKVAGEITTGNGTVSAPSYSFASATNTGFYWNGGVIEATVAGNRIYQILSTGLWFDASTSRFFEWNGKGQLRWFSDYVLGIQQGLNPMNWRIYSKDATGTNDRYTSNGWGSGADSLKYSIAQTYNGGSAQGAFYASGFSSYNFDGDLNITGNLLVSGSETYYAEMYFNDNSTAQTPTANDTLGIIYMSQGDLNGFTFDAGSTGAYTAVTDAGGGTISFASVAHGLAVGDWVMINGSSVAGYEGVHVVTYVATDSFRVAVAYSATATGNWQEPSTLTLTQAGLTNAKFKVDWNISGSVAGSPSGDAVVWGLYVNELPKVESFQIRTLSTGSVYGSYGSGAIVNMSTNDDLFMFFVSDDTNALTHKYGAVRVSKL